MTNMKFPERTRSAAVNKGFPSRTKSAGLAIGKGEKEKASKKPRRSVGKKSSTG